MKKKETKRWLKLDNAAKIFAPNSKGRSSNVFRFACELKEPVVPAILQEALDNTLAAFPLYRSILRRGLFWNYLEESDFKAMAHPEDRPIVSPIYNPNVKGLLFDVSYFDTRINLEVYHVLSDGTGALHFLRHLVYEYLILNYNYNPEKVEDLPYDASDFQKNEDSFDRYYAPKAQKVAAEKQPNAFQEKGPKWPESRIEVIEGHASVKEALKVAKSFGVSLTVYLTSVLFLSYSKLMTHRERKRPVVLDIPVNLRNYFPSESARNFFSLISVGYRFDSDPVSFEDILKSVEEQFKKQLTKERLLYKNRQLVRIEHIPIIRVIPLILKNPILRLANHMAHKKSTATLSNVGRIEMPDFCSQYIQRFDVFTSTHRTQLCLCSYLDNLTLSFSTAFSQVEVEKAFFRQLAEDGIPIEIVTSIPEKW